MSDFPDYDVFDLGSVDLQSGAKLKNAKLAFKTYGQMNEAGDNVVVLPTFMTGTHARNEGFFGAGRAIDPTRHFIVSINMFGNGLSTSPTNADATQTGPDFPNVTMHDNVRCQYILLKERFGVQRVALVMGWSMAGCQAYEWAAQFPDMVEAIVPVCASAKAAPHNIVFLEGVKAALQADQTWNGGRYVEPPARGLKAFARVYAGWAYSQTFYRDALYKALGYETPEDLLASWEDDHEKNWDANNLLAKIWTWQHCDLSANPRYQGDFAMALGHIKARATIIPCTQDLYFTVADNQIEVAAMHRAELRPYDSPWGHCVASPGNDPKFEKFLDGCISELLSAAR